MKESTIEPGALTSLAGTPAAHTVAQSKAAKEDHSEKKECCGHLDV
ncbi:hypothetical protein [Bradyrhizobium japonicum]|nr:hypothetical protein [Bradyrhizobium japonicum]